MSATAVPTTLECAETAGLRLWRRQKPRHERVTTPLVLLHGIGSRGQSFAGLMAALPEEIDVIAWDAPGYGGSRPLDNPIPAPRDYADALAAALDRLGIARIALVGHSLGALFATSFAAHHARRVSALALLSPALGYRVSTGEALPAKVQARIDDLQKLGPADFAKARAHRLVYQPERKPEIARAVEDAMAAVDPAGYAQAVQALGRGDLLADARRITAPALVAVGAQDVITPPDNARQAHEALTGSRFHQIADAGHALPQEAPQAVATLLAPLFEDAVHA
ncbi:MAG TPA: alpha/beta fold hydrolase [Pseudolabrys sp.]